MSEKLARYAPRPRGTSMRPWTLDEIERAGTIIARSGLFGVRTPEQAVALMLVAQGMGIHPAQAAQMFHIIDGRPSMTAQAMLARFQQMGGTVEWLERSDKKVSARFSHPQGGSVVVTWTLDDARRAGLLNRHNWQRYPRQMLTARVVSEGVRTVYPAAALGFYTTEEVVDIVQDETGRLPVNDLEAAGYRIVGEDTPAAPISEPEPEPEPKPELKPEPTLEAQVKALARKYFYDDFKFKNRAGAIGVLANALEQVFGGGEAAVEWRHWFLYGLFGKSSLKELGDHTLRALLDVLLPDGADSIPDDVAEQVRIIANRAMDKYAAMAEGVPADDGVDEA